MTTRTIALTVGRILSSLNTTMTTSTATTTSSTSRRRVAVGGAAAPRTLRTTLLSPTAATRRLRTSMVQVDRLPAGSTRRRKQVTAAPRISRRGKTRMVRQFSLDIDLELGA